MIDKRHQTSGLPLNCGDSPATEARTGDGENWQFGFPFRIHRQDKEQSKKSQTNIIYNILDVAARFNGGEVVDR